MVKYYDPGTIEQHIHHYRVLGGRFYEDGLESVYPIWRGTSIDEAWQKFVEACIAGETPILWAYDSEDTDDYSAMYVQWPYPHRWDAPVPDWVKEALSRSAA